MKRDHEGGKSKSLSKNPFLLYEGVVDLSVLILNMHVLGLVDKFRETKILKMNIILCFNSMSLKFWH